MPELSMEALAEIGAKIRLSELREEERELRQLFPSLDNGNSNSVRATPTSQDPAFGPEDTHGIGGKPLEHIRAAREPKERRPRVPMTAKQKKAVGQRMRQYWAQRKAQEMTGR